MTEYSKIWSAQHRSGNRFNESLYLERKACETHSILNDYCGYSSEPVADLGCGAGELLEKLLSTINIAKAVDYSQLMLAEARALLLGLEVKNTPEFICDGIEILPDLVEKVWISTGALSQYSSEHQLALILSHFQNNKIAEHLVLFDTIDPMRYFILPFIAYKNSYIHSSVAINSENLSSRSSVSSVLKLIRSLRSIFIHLNGGLFAFSRVLLVVLGSSQVYRLPGSLMGYGVLPSFWRTEGDSRGFRVSILSSREFEYRYHVVISKK